MIPIAHIENDFPTKFGIPRQSGRVGALKARIVFEPEYRNVDACRGLEEFSHIWLIWEFSEAKRTKWSPTVRPPRLGGNVRKGVFATRSPFRPNSIGLSCVKLEKVALDEPDSPVLYVEGADLMNGTPIFDIKPYIPYADCHPEATGSFTEYSKDHHLNVEFAIISEAGASVYSASQIAKEEFPDYHVEERSAVSIARRLQDPLAELVKIEPKAISVGQYQHDIPEKDLEEQLDFVVEKTVNNVGVDINTASKSLLKYVAGLNAGVAQQIVLYRNEHGKFHNRNEIKNVKKLGAKTYTQAIGFLRILDGDHPLDATAIHPENYQQALDLLNLCQLSLADLGTVELKDKLLKINKKEVIETLKIDQYTLDDIIDCLIKPNRSIRDQYQTPLLKKDILHIEDLKPGMVLEGTVRNVVDFGAFVDIGLKNDGLVHISKMSKQRIKHPLDVLSIGDIVEVNVIDVDLNKKRVSLSMI